MHDATRSYDVLKKLGWINTSSRKVLLVRYLHRILPALLAESKKIQSRRDADHLVYWLQLHRFLLEATTDAVTHRRLVNAPYEPTNQPNTFHLRGGRSGVAFTVRSFGDYPAVSIMGEAWGFELIHPEPDPLLRVSFDLLAEEIYESTTGTNLSTKRKVDERTTVLIQSAVQFPEWAPARIRPGMRLRTTRRNDDSPWHWWEEWHTQFCRGQFNDWPFASDVLGLPETLWRDEDAPAKVASTINAMRDEILLAKLPQVEDVFESADGRYDVRTTASDPSKLIDSIENRVRFTLDLAVRSNACDLNDMSTAATVLRHALDNCLDDPNALEQFLRRASDMIKARVADGSFASDDELTMLVATLDELALQLRADHPDVAQAVDARASQRFKELSQAKRLAGAQLIEDLREGTTGRLDTELGLATETLRDGSSDTANADALKQSGNRAGKISLAERAKAAESSGPMAGLKIGLRAHKVVEFVLGLISSGPM
ncbi:hypothetical protein [Tateyamaria sp. syn59]|uniref:hypothetical protein n=1 Tax=Tateyamaria sp. syn59 TaxID=2576942 RepID=UPI0011BFC3C9|nr:hypothetical protein [Tateyamaria sp. syn59]